MTKTVRWSIAGVGVASIGLGVYFLFFSSKRKSEHDFTPKDRTTPITIYPQGKATPVVEPNWEKPFDSKYSIEVKQWLSGIPIKELPVSVANVLAKEVKNAKGRFNDKEEVIAAIFGKKLLDKTQVSTLSRVFWDRYKMDMWQYLKGFLSTQELYNLVTLAVKRLPNYRRV